MNAFRLSSSVMTSRVLLASFLPSRSRASIKPESLLQSNHSLGVKTQKQWFSQAKKGLSRTERRLLERKQRNREKKNQATTNDAEKQQNLKPKSLFERILPSMASKNGGFSIPPRIRRMLYPRIPGSSAEVTWDHLVALGYRLPFFAAIAWFLTSDDYFPYTINGSLGPSMLPTMQFFGDIWVIQTGAWKRLLGWQPHQCLQNGDIVLWKDPQKGRVSCKRVVGLPGDRVQRYGEYVHLYRDRKDLGIIWPRERDDYDLDPECPWDEDRAKDAGEHKYYYRTLEVPEGHVWLEGDCPLFSLDSRHYGPVPGSWIRGRISLRVWPLSREDEEGNAIPRSVSRDRPVPYPSMEDYLGKQFNLYRVPPKKPDEN